MKKYCLFLVLLGCLEIHVSYAQTGEIAGIVTSAEDGGSIPGASVLVKGTSSGTITDINGRFVLKVNQGEKTIIVSFVGMETVEVQLSSARTYNVVLVSSRIAVDEIVVTAFGMRRERKALGYAVQDVKNDALTRTGTGNFATALQGKLSGVEIKPSSGMPGASTQIIIRGARSFSGNNQPLYVVDGMPVASNADYSTGNSVTGADIANRSVDIDPGDIESVNILKGQAAAALYGIRASNGVVVITTKSGKGARKGKPVVTVSTFGSSEIISRKPEYQTTWAQGTPNATGYTFSPTSSSSWGPKISDLPNDKTYGGNVPNANNGNDASRYPGKYYVPQRFTAGMDPWVTPQVYDNVSEFFKSGMTLNSSLNVSQASDNGSYSFGLGNTTQTGIIPGTSLDRYTAKASAELKLSSIWKTGFSANYNQTYIKKASGGSDGVVSTVFGAPKNYDLKGIPYASPGDPYQQILYRSTTFNNPYWAVEHNRFEEKTNRFFGNGFIEFNPVISSRGDKRLRFRYQLGADSYSTHYQDIQEYKSKNTLGSMSNYGVTSATYNSLLTANFDMDITDFLKLNVMIGNEVNQENYKYYTETGNNFNFGGWPHISNTTIKDATETQLRNRTVGLFGTASLSYKNMLYLSATSRNDIVSSMPHGNRSFYYPSVSAGFILTELEGLQGNNVLSFGKLRASWAQVGQAGTYYENYYTVPNYVGGFWTGTPIVYPISGVTSFIPNSVMYDPKLKPQNTVSYEIGADLNFFDNRFGIEYTYSRQDVNDQIFPVPLAGSTGATELVMNGGAIYTNIHEATIMANPVRGKDIDWIINVNFTRMDNYVKELAPGVESIFLGGFATPQVRAGIGYRFPVIYGTAFAKDAQGRILVNENPASPYHGFPMAGKPDVIGTASPDFILGATTTFRYRRISLTATADWKNGGQMYHGTNGLLEHAYGLAKSTEDRSTQFVYPGYKENGQPSDIKRGGTGDLAAYYYLNANILGTIDESAIYNNSFVKLRELALSYKVPGLGGLDLNITGFARNILLWTNLPNFDPEATQGNTNMGGAFERFTVPQAMSFGLGLNLAF